MPPYRRAPLAPRAAQAVRREVPPEVTTGWLIGIARHLRAVLTLRYLDGLGVAEVAGHLDRGVRATEALLVRARRAFRAAYTARIEDGGDEA